MSSLVRFACLLLLPLAVQAFVQPLPGSRCLYKPRTLSMSTTDDRPSEAIKELNTLREFHAALREPRSVPAVFRFHAGWCRACKSFEPCFQEFSRKYGDHFEFFDVDITQDQRLFVKELGLTALPHIQIAIGGRAVESFGTGCKKREQLDEALSRNKKRQY